MRSMPIYEVHAIKYAHLPRKAWEVQINPDPHDADFPMDYFVWVAIPIDESGHRTIGGKPIVIDTGFNAAVGKKRGRGGATNPGASPHRSRIESQYPLRESTGKSPNRERKLHCKKMRGVNACVAIFRKIDALSAPRRPKTTAAAIRRRE